MKSQLTATRTRPWAMEPAGTEAALCFQEELVAAIHGALELAVEMAIGEVKTLLRQATDGIYEDLRRENESLKEQLQKAETMLDAGHRDESDVSPAGQLLSGLRSGDESDLSGSKHTSLHHGTTGSGVHPTGQDGEHPHVREGVSSEEDDETRRRSRDAELHRGRSERFSGDVSVACTVKVKCENPVPQGPQDSAPHPSIDFKPTIERVTAKEEEPETAADGAPLDFIKVEDLIQEDTEPQVPDDQSHHPHQPSSSSSELDQALLPNITTSVPLASALQSGSSRFPNIFQLPKPAAESQSPTLLCGFEAQVGCNFSHIIPTVYTCKFCRQTFQLPSLLRRHYSQCQQRLQQRCQQPKAGGKRRRLQLYPPGCSPFRCTVCNREFNRMENLKTHLRIHTGERPYTCSVCSKCFRHSGALTRHFRIHTGEKPYICGQCGKSFRNCDGLKFHQRSHSK